MKKPHTKKGTTRFWADKEEKISLSGFSVGTDWMLLVGLFTLLFAGLLFWSWSTYRNVVEESYLKDSVQAESRTRVNEEQLNRVLSNFEERRSRFEDLSGGFTFTLQRGISPVLENASSTVDITTATTSTSTVETFDEEQ